MEKKRRHYPGEVREPGTKDYAVILSHLIKYRNLLLANRTLQADEALDLFNKISEKLNEIGFPKAAKKVKRKASSANNISKKVEEVVGIAAEKWREGKEQHEQVRIELKEKEKEEKKKNRKQRTRKSEI
ncbi:MAG: hypothetical protein R3E32_28990 [Chitinophagales bacterium]